MSRDDQDEAKKQQQIAAAEDCVEKSKTYQNEVESLLDAARGYEDKLRRHRPNWQNLFHSMKRVEKKKVALERILNNITGTNSSSNDNRAVQNLTTEIKAELVRWQALKQCSSAVFFGQTFNGRTDEQRLHTAKSVVAQRDGVSLEDLENGSLYPKIKGKKEPGGHVCKVNGEVCAKEVFHLVRDLATQDSAQVDVVSGGQEWVDVRSLLEHRLVEHMNEAGWDWGEYQLGDVVPKEDYEDVPLVRRYKWLCEAAKMNRIEFEIPTIRLCLPSIGREKEEIAVLLDQIQRMDPDVKVIIEDKDSWMFKQGVPEDWMEKLIKPVDFDISESVVIEMTLIITLISEISHAHLEEQPWHCRQVKAQIAEEKRGLRAVETIYPLLRGRKLLVTRSTVEKLRELLEIIGTSREIARAHLLLPDLAAERVEEQKMKGGLEAKQGRETNGIGVPGGEETRNMGAENAEATRQALSDLSVHEVPSDLQIPFEVIEDGWSAAEEFTYDESSEAINENGSIIKGTRVSPTTASPTTTSSSTASPAQDHLLPLITSSQNITTTRAILAAWTNNLTILTGNAALRKQIHKWIDELGHQAKGPRIVVSKTCRIMLSAEIGPAKMFYKEDGTVDSQKLREWRMSRESKVVRAD